MTGRLLAVAALALVAPASAYADDADRLAAAVRDDPVHVAASQRARLSAAGAGQVRVRIARKDAGRIKVAVVSSAAARRSGGLDALANAVAARLQRPGTLVLIAGPHWWLNTSFPPGGVVAAVREATAEEHGLRRELLAAVDGIASADPGPRADPADAGASVPATGPGPAPQTITIPGLDTVAEGAKTGLELAGVALLAAVLAVVLFFVVRARRRRHDAEEVLADMLAEARAAHVAVGESLTDLDLTEEMPGAAEEGKASYARALELYDQADQALQAADNPRRARRAAELVAAARAEVDRAQELLSGPTPR